MGTQTASIHMPDSVGSYKSAPHKTGWGGGSMRLTITGPSNRPSTAPRSRPNSAEKSTRFRGNIMSWLTRLIGHPLPLAG